MTMIAACRFDEGAIVIADSRATWRGKEEFYQDQLQKILSLGPKTAICFAGDVRAAGLIVHQLRKRIVQNPRLKFLRKLAAETPRLLKHYYRLYSTKGSDGLSFILAGVDSAGNIGIWGYDSPLFQGQKLTSGFLVLGSGAVVKSYIQENWLSLERDCHDLKARADRLLSGLGADLGKEQITTVGGLFQTILLDSDGIRTLKYHFMTLDPAGAPRAKSMDRREGRWIQRDDSKGIEIPLVEPTALVRVEAIDLRFHDYEPYPSGKPKWHMTYFLTCQKIEKTVGTIEFDGTGTAFGLVPYPQSVRFVVAVGVWGTSGDHKIELRLTRDNHSETIHTESVRIEYFPEEIDLAIPVIMHISKPGLVFLECYISGQLLGRRALYFGDCLDRPASTKDLLDYVLRMQEKVLEEQNACRDNALEDSGRSELVYLTLCQGCTDINGTLKFEHQFVSTYSRLYPLKLRAFIASAIRTPQGDHVVRLDLVDGASHQISTISSTNLTSTSSCTIKSIHGELIALVPKPGVYFVNLSVDDQLLGSTILAAETGDPTYLFRLPRENLDQVAAGEVLVLLKRCMPLGSS
jgi:hypothetical protein